MKWIILIVVAIVIICVIAVIISESESTETRSTASGSVRVAPNIQWNDTPQRQVAARSAANQMNAHKMNNAGAQAVQIKQVVHQRNININISSLNTAQDKIMRICAHAERIRNEIERHRNNPAYLKQLYRTGVGISNEAYTLRNDIKSMNDTLYRMSKNNSSLCSLFNQVHSFYNSVYADEVELNNRNRILRTYIGRNFGVAEKRWNDEIEARVKAKRAE